MRADDRTSKEPSKQHNISELERQEEDEIAWLEHHLYGKKGPSQKEGDDVDDLLDDLNRFYPGMYEASEGEADEDDLEGSDASEDRRSDEDRPSGRSVGWTRTAKKKVGTSKMMPRAT